MTRRMPLAASAALTALALAGCGSAGAGGAAGSGGSGGGAGDKLDVVVSFYPLQYAVEQIGGQHVAVTNLTKPGAEPHDIELSPKDVATVSKARLAVYEKGLQPTVDDAVKEVDGDRVLDVATAADLTIKHDPVVGGERHGHAGESAEEHAGHSHGPGAQDPHFWLDPQRYTKVAEAVAARLGQVDPAHRVDYERNLATLRTTLHQLDRDFAAGLQGCASKNLVTSHAAFGYLADRYGFTQVAIAGLSPEQEPDPATLAEVARYAKANRVSTIYTETLASPALAQTVAKETGARTAVLDPLEGITPASAGKDYVEVMKANLATLRKGQTCR
ncbi:metal ABC transporter substrate-binding protein [Arsenicicoccus sp. oral taxon 190]|uniref:metal ABC transporter substrate-binding protein n=1 Tax=Arsenicicoccus sp. oral taxon 190 TaxID=1658671 RepID=UPI00067A02C8|nr:metal ABC transporter substrate-binding protein [Arsenicicoccus sp. oral taxon 190]AKT51135.1 ABC transporter substrate-binding protein [Arsenicicoccus sp. oral taxon 190]